MTVNERRKEFYKRLTEQVNTKTPEEQAIERTKSLIRHKYGIRKTQDNERIDSDYAK